MGILTDRFGSTPAPDKDTAAQQLTNVALQAAAHLDAGMSNSVEIAAHSTGQALRVLQDTVLEVRTMLHDAAGVK